MTQRAASGEEPPQEHQEEDDLSLLGFRRMGEPPKKRTQAMLPGKITHVANPGGVIILSRITSLNISDNPIGINGA
eukprot:CAMPEP_0202917172 /NCGR_PEP_ID=MMETSP1392-20130828/70389_1 /ASSEMBLY_ACC=CAM_ASM_000868 /TAXON_ID=225041 /ORGANISM="Chlamydomonas chlamydogama, Strain SAG 11-48b" /LENGTH=75 /DNA_ID=CAMNT_0049609835 /DNA_START=11 /DNA_END=234 /DNA_ORIENTATION=+